MNKKIPERYQKSLVTVAMGFRTEEDIQKNGLHRFIKKEKKDLIKYITSLYNRLLAKLREMEIFVKMRYS